MHLNLWSVRFILQKFELYLVDDRKLSKASDMSNIYFRKVTVEDKLKVRETRRGETSQEVSQEVEPTCWVGGSAREEI